MFAASSVHAVAVVLIVTVVLEIWTSVERSKWTDFGPVAVFVEALGALAAVAACFFIDRYVKNAGLNGRAGVAYILCVLAFCLVAILLAFHVMKPSSDWFQVPVLCAVAVVTGLALGTVLIGLTVVASAWYRNSNAPSGPELFALPEIAGMTGSYVALGDSYSAGEGLRPFDAFTSSDIVHGGDGCHRSSMAYPQLLRFSAPSPPQRFVACSGAVTFDIFHELRKRSGESQVTVASQVDDYVHNDVGLVTISIGGNDVVFSKVVVHCFLHTDCLNRTFRSPPDDPKRNLRFPDDQHLASWATDALTIVQQKVTDLYPELRERYPNARIVVVGYPYLFPDRGAPVLGISAISDCQSILRRFSRSERVAVRALQDRLNEVLYHAALAAGVEFVSPADGWNGHEPCGSSGQQYTNSIKPFIQFESATDFVDGGTFHPNAAGQRELGRLVTCYLVTHPQSPKAGASESAPGSLDNPVTC
jgi:lysophospholipase L1-like esterase